MVGTLVWVALIVIQIFIGIGIVGVFVYRAATLLGFTAKSKEIEPWSIREIRFALLFLTAVTLAILAGVRVAREQGLSAILPS